MRKCAPSKARMRGEMNRSNARKPIKAPTPMPPRKKQSGLRVLSNSSESLPEIEMGCGLGSAMTSGLGFLVNALVIGLREMQSLAKLRECVQGSFVTCTEYVLVEKGRSRNRTAKSRRTLNVCASYFVCVERHELAYCLRRAYRCRTLPASDASVYASAGRSATASHWWFSNLV